LAFPIGLGHRGLQDGGCSAVRARAKKKSGAILEDRSRPARSYLLGAADGRSDIAHLCVDAGRDGREAERHCQPDEHGEERVLDEVLALLVLDETLEQILHDALYLDCGRHFADRHHAAQRTPASNHPSEIHVASGPTLDSPVYELGLPVQIARRGEWSPPQGRVLAYKRPK